MRKAILLLILVFALTAACSSKTKEELYQQGVQAAEQGNYNGAIVYFRNALEKDQNFFEARFQLAKAYLATARFDQAERELQKVLLQSPNHPEIRLQLAWLYVFTGKTEQGRAEAETFLQSTPGSAEAFELIGISHVQDEKAALAEEFLRKALQSEPDRPIAKLELARLHAARGETLQARAMIQEVLAGNPENVRAHALMATLEAAEGNTDALLQRYQTIAELDPNDVLSSYRMGLLHMDRGDVEQAEAIASDLVQRFPRNPEGHRLKGILYYRAQNHTEAIVTLQRSLAMRPSIEGSYFLGLSMQQTGELETALSHLRAAIDLNPNFVQARLMTAIILLQQQRIDPAVTEARRVLSIDPRNAMAHNILGSAHLAQGRVEEGMQALKRAIEIDPSIVDAHLKMGLVHLSQGRTAEAETNLVNAVQVAPEVLSPRQMLFFHYMRQQEPAKAYAVMQEGLTGTRADAVLYNNMAAALFAQNRGQEGVEHLLQAKAADPEFVGSSMNLAGFYASSFQYDKALEEYDHVLRHNPDNLRALLGSAAILELQGKDKETLDRLVRARQSGEQQGFAALAGYHVRKGNPGKGLSVLDEGIKSMADNLALKELKGRTLMDQNRIAEALDVFEDIRLADPVRGMTLKISAHMRSGDVEKAMDQASQVVILNPNSAYGYMLQASIFEAQGKPSTAKETLLQGIGRDRENIQALMQLATLHARAGELDQAMATYDRVISIQRDFAPASAAKGMIHHQGGRLKQAEAAYLEALQKDPNNLVALNNLATLYVTGPDKRRALEMAVRAFQIEPGNPAVMDTLGKALLENGHPEQAVRVLERAVTLLPDNGTVLYHYALASNAVGDRATAVATLERAVQLTGYPEADNARRLLDEVRKQ
jgi:putative PEP-CTERM system TPR-repeat lipoprotein